MSPGPRTASTASTLAFQRRRAGFALAVEFGAVIGRSSVARRVTGPGRSHRARPAGPHDGRGRSVATPRPQRTVVPLRPAGPADAGLDRKVAPPLPARAVLSVGRPSIPAA